MKKRYNLCSIENPVRSKNNPCLTEHPHSLPLFHTIHLYVSLTVLLLDVNTRRTLILQECLASLFFTHYLPKHPTSPPQIKPFFRKRNRNKECVNPPMSYPPRPYSPITLLPLLVARPTNESKNVTTVHRSFGPWYCGLPLTHRCRCG